MTVRIHAVSEGVGEDADLAIALRGIGSGSAILPESTRAEDGSGATFAGEISLLLTAGGETERAVEGVGHIALTEQRVIGVVTEGCASDGAIDLRTEETGTGALAVFTVRREALREVDTAESDQGRVRHSSLIGDGVRLVVEAHGAMSADGGFRACEDHVFATAAQRYVSRSDEVLLPADDAVAASSPVEPSADAQPEERPRLPSPGRTVPSHRGRRLAAVVLAVALVAAAGTLGAVSIMRPAKDAPAPPSDNVAAAEATPVAGQAESPAAPDPEGDVASTGGNAGAEPASEARFVRLGSYRTRATAEGQAARLSARRLDPQVVSSDRVAGMMPAFWVVVAGPLSGDREEKRIIKQAAHAGVSDAFAGGMAPALPADRSEVVDTFAGKLMQRSPTVERLNRDIAATVTIQPGGKTGHISYGRPHCRSQLRLLGWSGTVARYSEQVTDGRCSDGGVWYLKVEPGRLRATWWRDDDTMFRIGTLERSGDA